MNRSNQIAFFYHDYSTINHEANVEVKLINNSLVNFTSLTLNDANSLLKMTVNHPSFIPLGFFYNYGSSRGHFEIKGDSGYIKNINNNSYSTDKVLVFARPFHSIIQCRYDLTFEIRLNLQEAEEVEMTEFCTKATNFEIKNSNFELISIIFVNLPNLLGDDYPLWSLKRIAKLQHELYLEGSKRSAFINDLYANDWKILEEINNSQLPNMALNCPAQQSSFYSKDFQKINSEHGNVINKGFFFHTSLEENPWWNIDLGMQKDINAILVYNRSDVAKERIKYLRIFISKNGVDWDSIYNHNGRPAFGGYDDADSIPPLVLKFDNTINTRFIKIDLEDNNYLHLGGVEIY